MHSFSCEGFILKRKNYGEADKLITLFTKNHGKIISLAKGVRKITSRRAGSLELLNRVKVSLHQTKSLPILTEAQVQNSYPDLKIDLNKLSIAFMVLELTDRLFAENQENTKVFDMLTLTLSRINEAQTLEESKKIQISFQIKLLTETGYLPQLYKCTQCEEPLTKNNLFLSPNSGGLIDDKCSRNIIFSKKISSEEVKVLRFLNNESFSFVDRLKLSKNLLETTTELLNYYTTYFLERNLNSFDFAEHLQRLYLPS